MSDLRNVSLNGSIAFEFFVQKSLIDTAETDAKAGETGLVEADFTVRFYNAGDSAFANLADSDHVITEIGNGWYRYASSAAAITDTAGMGVMEVTYDPGVLGDGYEGGVVWVERYIVGPIDANVTQVSGSATAADNLELQYNGTGLTGQSFPMRQDQRTTDAGKAIGDVAAAATSRTLNTGTETNTLADAATLDSTAWVLNHAAGDLDVEANFQGAAGDLGTAVFVQIALTAGTIFVEARNWTAATWERLGVISGIASGVTQTFVFNLSSAHTDGTGLRRIRFVGSSLAANLSIQRMLGGYVPAVTLGTDAITADVIADSAAEEIAAAVGARTVEGSATHDDLIRLLVGVITGPSSGYGTNTLIFKSLDGSKTRITITKSTNGRDSVLPGDYT